MRVGLFLIAVLINLNIWSQNSGDYPIDIPIICRVVDGKTILDLRTVHPDDDEVIAAAITALGK